VNVPDTPAAPPDPRHALADRLLRASAWLKATRVGFDAHRTALLAFVTIDSHSDVARSLASWFESVERHADQLAREVARVSANLSADALEDALKLAPELPDAPKTDPGAPS
jgi:hypothetical protein